MIIAISNIAWSYEDDEDVALAMQSLEIGAVEVAPTKIWPNLEVVSNREVIDYRRFWNERGIRISSLQSLLFGRPDLTIFESKAKAKRTLDYLTVVMRVGGLLGAGPLVFGSPKNRRIGKLHPGDAFNQAVEFFGIAGEIARDLGVVLCIEPNPPQYDCDFVTDTQTGIKLVSIVDNPGFGLHLDAAAMTLAGDSIDHSLEGAGPFIRHFHASEPQLKPLGEGGVKHQEFAEALRRQSYGGVVSVEMRQETSRETIGEIRRVLEFANAIYG